MQHYKKTLEASKNLNENFDSSFVNYNETLYLDLKNHFGEQLWTNYVQLAACLHEVHDGKYQSVNITVEVLDKIKDIKHQVFLTFRRLIGLSCVTDNGPCPLCLKQCDKKTNPRATSHVIADAAIRAIIAQFDNRMDRSIAFFKQGVLVKGKNGPSSIKWKMLCRECEQFVSSSGEKCFTALLKDALHTKNVTAEIPDAHWRFTFAATLLWRTMDVVQPFANCTDVSAMYPLYDEFNEKMSKIEPIAEIYVSDLSSKGDKCGLTLGLFYGGSSSCGNDCGYVHAQIWNFHFFGFFNKKSQSTSQDDITKFLDRCTVIRDATTNMTKFKEQSAIPEGIFPVQNQLIGAAYYSDTEIVTYKEVFSGEDKFFGVGFDLVFQKSKFEDENVLVANFLSLVVDLHGFIKKWLDGELC